MLRFDYLLNAISFVFTLFIIVYGIYRGLDNIELVVNFLYFTTLNVTFLYNLIKIK